MPEISIRGATRKPPPTFPPTHPSSHPSHSHPLRHPLPPPVIRPVARKAKRTRRAKKTMRQRFGVVVLCFGLLTAAYSWTTAERDPERPPLMNLGARTEVMRPLCICEGRPPKVGSCQRVGYLGVRCWQLGFELALPLGIPLIGGLALAGLGASMMRRKDPSEFAWLPPA